MTPEVLTLIATFFVCSEAADQRMLTHAELTFCNQTFEEVKASFVPGVEVEDYPAMSPAERREANDMGYAGYLQWRADNTTLVETMEAEARDVLERQDGKLL
ncbi:MAG: hypothetical protein AAF092_13400 [Pseudomonadota bacterium]